MEGLSLFFHFSCLSLLDTFSQLRTFGKLVDSGAAYAGALILFALKLILGLDGHSENEISGMASQANEILGLKPSSAFAKTSSSGAGRAEGKTLFVWKEWVRFIHYRRLVLESHHVPTAVRHNAINRMDPDVVMAFVRNDGYLRCRSVKKLIPSQQRRQEEVLKLLDQLAYHLPSPDPSTKRIFSFEPTLLPRQGLAEQLLHSDPHRFALLRQSFSSSSLKFALRPEKLARALREKAVSLQVCQGPAWEELDLLVSEFLPSYYKYASSKGKPPRYAFKPARLKRHVREEPGRRNLLLHQPWNAYWTRSMCGNQTINRLDWKVLSAQLPPTFRWMLKEVAESCSEKPRDLYLKLRQVETILLRWTQATHTLLPDQVLKRRLNFAKHIVL